MPETELYGLVNGHLVAGGLYRSGDIERVGLATLAHLHIERVICLKNSDDRIDVETEKGWLEDIGVEFIWYPLNQNGRFSYSDIKKIPTVLEMIESASTRVLVHCHHGSDRTGVVIACWRIKHKGWTADRAIAEMRKYGNAFYNWGMRRAVADYARTKANAQAA